MSAAPLDAAAKQRVKDALKAHANAEIAASGDAESAEHSAAELDQDASYSSDDLSQSDEAGELSVLLGDAREQQQANLARIDQLDFGVKEVVEPGAIIAFGGESYVVGVVASTFECDGVSYEGISADSPIYAAIEGLRGGDAFTFNDHQHHLDMVC